MLIAAGVFVWLTDGALPSVVASHFGPGGRADGFMAKGPYTALMLALVVAVPAGLSSSSTPAKMSRTLSHWPARHGPPRESLPHDERTFPKAPSRPFGPPFMSNYKGFPVSSSSTESGWESRSDSCIELGLVLSSVLLVSGARLEVERSWQGCGLEELQTVIDAVAY